MGSIVIEGELWALGREGSELVVRGLFVLFGSFERKRPPMTGRGLIDVGEPLGLMAVAQPPEGGVPDLGLGLGVVLRGLLLGIGCGEDATRGLPNGTDCGTDATWGLLVGICGGEVVVERLIEIGLEFRPD